MENLKLRNELFVEEASSQISDTQDGDFEAIYKLRGKVKNVAYGSTSNLDKELPKLIQIMES